MQARSLVVYLGPVGISMGRVGGACLLWGELTRKFETRDARLKNAGKSRAQATVTIIFSREIRLLNH